MYNFSYHELDFSVVYSTEKKTCLAHVVFLTHFFRQLLFFGPMSFKLAVTLQKDAPGDTDHGERLSGQKY